MASRSGRSFRYGAAGVTVAAVLLIPGSLRGQGQPDHGGADGWHDGVQATTFWAGELYDPDLGVEGQNISSAWDVDWTEHHGGCDGVEIEADADTGNVCGFEERVAAEDFMPRAMTPRENPFYLALPFDDLNNDDAFSQRANIPWADDPGYAGRLEDRDFSYMKNRWVQVEGPDGSCYGQIEDAGPGEYADFGYVFGDAPPIEEIGIDLSPSLYACVGLGPEAGIGVVSWRFVDRPPPGPWTEVVTVRQVDFS